MPRVKVGTLARRRRKRTLKLAKGYFGSKHLLYKTANEQVMKSLTYSYRDRKKRKSDFRKLWISRINAAARQNGLSYSRMINGLKQADAAVNRKMLADIAVYDEDGFKELCETAKKGLKGEKPTPKKVTAKSAPKQAAKKAEPNKAEPKQEKPSKEEASKPELSKEALEGKTVDELKEMCKEKGITGYSALKKAELVDTILEHEKK